MQHMLYLSHLIERTVRGTSPEVIGQLKDLVVQMTGEPLPLVTGLVVAVPGRRGHRCFIASAYVLDLDPNALRLSTSMIDLRPFARRTGEALLQKDVLDKQVVDIHGRRVIRVNDVTLTKGDRGWVLAGADVSTAALLDRLGLHTLAARMPREVIPWDAVQFLASEVPGTPIQLTYDKLARLHPMDIADLLNELGYPQGSEVISALDESLAAHVVAGFSLERQTAVFGAMGVEKAAHILDEMAPDEAADLLLELPEAQAEALLEAMEAPAAAAVKRLLDYPEDTAGGMMTTEYVAVPQTLTSQQVIDRLRSYAWLPSLISYLYVVESEEQGRLVGVLSLRDLLMAETDTAITALMQRDIATGHVHDAAEDVARVIAHYNLLALPIIDTHGDLAGIVTVDDAMDIILPHAWKNRLPRIFT